MLTFLTKVFASFCMGLLVIGLAGIYRGEQLLERVGHGANIVLLFDRSSSMDQTFAGRAPDGKHESKSSAARRLLLSFVNKRQDDRIGIVNYSTSPMLAMPLTENRSSVIAAINATATPGLAYTNISKGLAMALSLYQNEHFVTESDIILLISDGAAAIDADNERYLRKLFAARKMRLYWIFLRGRNNPGIFEKPEDPRDDNAQARPERYLHLFFKSLSIPYQAYEAENTSPMKAAVTEIDGIEKQPFHYLEKIPRQDLTAYCYAISTVLLMLIFIGKLTEVR